VIIHLDGVICNGRDMRKKSGQIRSLALTAILIANICEHFGEKGVNTFAL